MYVDSQVLVTSSTTDGYSPNPSCSSPITVDASTNWALGKRIRSLLVVLVGVSLAWGCGAPQRNIQPAEIRPLPFAAWRGNGANWSYVPVKGLDSALAHSPNAPVRVLVVHGMKTHRPEYSAVLQQGLAKRLGLVPQRPLNSESSAGLIRIFRGYNIGMSVGPQPLDTVTLRTSEIRKQAWIDPRTSQERIVFYEMLWAPLRDDVKDRFFACFESGPSADRRCPPPGAERNTDRRAALNGALKDGVLVDGVADATIVLGPVGDVLRDDVTLAFCQVATDVLQERGFMVAQPSGRRCDLAASVRPQDRGRANEALRNAEFFAMTHSLGSFLVMDAHWQAMETAARHDGKEDEAAIARDVAAFYLLDDATVFMRANQVALLQLARLRPVCAPLTGRARCPNEALETEDQWLERSGAFGTFTQYVAFNDANDLLGFELPPYLSTPGMFGTLVNVTVRNPARWRFPRLFKNPGEAHTRSDENPAILDKIVTGFPLPKENAPSKSADKLPSPLDRKPANKVQRTGRS